MPMNGVVPIVDEPTRFMVPSSQVGEPHHLVDIENLFHPECSCRQWETVCHPNWKRNGGIPVPYNNPKQRTFCRHSVEVFEYLLKLSSGN